MYLRNCAKVNLRQERLFYPAPNLIRAKINPNKVLKPDIYLLFYFIKSLYAISNLEIWIHEEKKKEKESKSIVSCWLAPIAGSLCEQSLSRNEKKEEEF